MEDSMKKLMVLALMGSFALVGYAAEETKPEPKKACKMACCEKSKAASCKDCQECGKKQDKKPEAAKKG